MIVLVVTACPAGLRGHLTRWLLEISPGVFVGRVTARVRDLMWERVLELAKDGRALLVFTAANEQRLDFRVHRHDWEPIDFDGVQLIRRPPAGVVRDDRAASGGRRGWSRESQQRMAARNGVVEQAGSVRQEVGEFETGMERGPSSEAGWETDG